MFILELEVFVEGNDFGSIWKWCFFLYISRI